MSNQAQQSPTGYYVDKMGFAYVASQHIAGRAAELGLTFVPSISGPQITVQPDVDHHDKFHFSVQFPGATVWDFGDGASAKTDELTITHDYAAPGVYQVRAIQKSGSSDATVTVEAPVVAEALDVPPPPVEDNVLPPQGKPRALTKAEKAKMKQDAEEASAAFEAHEARLAEQAAAVAADELTEAELLAELDKE